MVYKGTSHLEMDDDWGYLSISGTPHVGWCRIPNFFCVPEIKHGRKLADETTKMLYGGEDGMWGMEDA